MKNSYNETIANSLKLISDYLSNMKGISYEEIMELLNNKNANYHIEFSESYDMLTSKYYKCVIVRNRKSDINDRSKYLAPDENDLEIYQNMVNSIISSTEEPRFQIFDNELSSNKKDLICGVEGNLLVFPSSILKILMNSAVEEENKRENDIACKYKNQTLYIPSNLRNNSEEKQNVFQRILKKISR